ncbi:hypothetical protein [Evansella clarkii]|uniref:hypothetical protein n=1 Tax=Evansella clarkii TaxID=79879 RepID=UPI0009971BBD|nr:hypothetical protein [Evansella clarkii]
MARTPAAIFAIVLALLTTTFTAFIATAAADNENVYDDEEQGESHEGDTFIFDAFINPSEITDGTEGFDDDNEPGNDAGPHNGIVRTWDTITYPVKLTVNSKTEEAVNDVVLRFSGTLDGGIGDDRVNAKFSSGGTEDIENGVVSFEQEYTIGQSGSSIMFPIVLDVLGATHGVELTPEISVEVISVDGEDVEPGSMVTHFDNLPTTTTSAKVNIKPFVDLAFPGLGMPYYPYSGITGNDDDVENIHGVSVSWGLDNLDNKTDNRGATFPHADGEIQYRIELSGEVTWNQGNEPTRPLNFSGTDTPFMLYDHMPIGRQVDSDHPTGLNWQHSIGRENMLAEGRSYWWQYGSRYNAPHSFMNDKWRNTPPRNSVLDSGEWRVGPAEIDDHVVTYRGVNSDYRIGSTFPTERNYSANFSAAYSEDDRIFASHSFLARSPNEYRLGGENNPDRRSNSVNYRMEVYLEGYVDENGAYHDLGDKRVRRSFTEDSVPEGLALQNDFTSYPSNVELGTHRANRTAPGSKGDASIIIGEDVQYRARISSQFPFQGGTQIVYRWNTDAFELTERYAEEGEANFRQEGYQDLSLVRHRNDDAAPHQMIRYGVPRFDRSDNEFDTFVRKGKDDYDWYDTYNEAIEHGVIGAIMNDITAPTGLRPSSSVRVPLKVKHENIGTGAVTKDGTAIVVTSNGYAYLDRNRSEMVNITENNNYNNPSEWDAEGNLLNMQSPRTIATNFETLAVIPARTDSTIEAERSSYYNSDIIDWTVRSNIVLPEAGIPEGIDPDIRVEQTLPRGLDYVAGSGRIGDMIREPEGVTDSNGKTTLSWRLHINDVDLSLPDITFQTSINPHALNQNSSQSSVRVDNVITSPLDLRSENFRSDSASVTILKVGMVGVYGMIDATHGDRNSEFTVTMRPYTTISEESNVKTLTHLPLSGDMAGSRYSGDAVFTDIRTIVDREYDGDVTVYLNNNPVYSDEPHRIDTSTGGWYKMTGSTDVTSAVSVLLHVEGVLSSLDDVLLNMTIQTSDNEFGDRYMTEAVINSDTNYPLSAVSNRVQYLIRADLEIGIDRFRIYTNTDTDGLPTSTWISQVVLEPDNVRDTELTFAIYNTNSGEMVVSKTLEQEEIPSRLELMIPPDVLAPDSMQNYEVRIQDYDTDKVWLIAGMEAVDTNGYTSSRVTLTEDDEHEDGIVRHEGVVATERVAGEEEMDYFHERIAITHTPESELEVKSGYAFNLQTEIAYENDLLADVGERLGVPFKTDSIIRVANDLIDSTLSHYDSSAEQSPVLLDRQDVNNTPTGSETQYQLPPVYLEHGSGYAFTNAQIEAGDVDESMVQSGGYRLYVPVWINDTGMFPTNLQHDRRIGSNRIGFDVKRDVNVYAYMFSHTDSETPDEDELLIHPMVQDEIPDDW